MRHCGCGKRRPQRAHVDRSRDDAWRQCQRNECRGSGLDARTVTAGFTAVRSSRVRSCALDCGDRMGLDRNGRRTFVEMTRWVHDCLSRVFSGRWHRITMGRGRKRHARRSHAGADPVEHEDQAKQDTQQGIGQGHGLTLSESGRAWHEMNRMNAHGCDRSHDLNIRGHLQMMSATPVLVFLVGCADCNVRLGWAESCAWHHDNARPSMAPLCGPVRTLQDRRPALTPARKTPLSTPSYSGCPTPASWGAG